MVEFFVVTGIVALTVSGAVFFPRIMVGGFLFFVLRTGMEEFTRSASGVTLNALYIFVFIFLSSAIALDLLSMSTGAWKFWRKKVNFKEKNQ